MARRKPYLNNRDLLKEIHKSKTTFCSYTDEEYSTYDIILPNLERINTRTTAEAKRNRCHRIAKLQLQEHEKLYPTQKFKLADFMENWKKLTKQDVIYRIMSYDHIPLEPGRKKTPKTTADHHVKLNFGPFQHWKFDEADKLIMVGKSHWDGGIENGWYCKDHGSITNNLANMYMKLCTRYGTRGNWRGYTYNDEMQAQGIAQLTQVCLQFDESKSDNPFAYYTAIINAAFTRVLNLEKRGQNIRDDILQINNFSPSFTRQSMEENKKYDDPARSGRVKNIPVEEYLEMKKEEERKK